MVAEVSMADPAAAAAVVKRAEPTCAEQVLRGAGRSYLSPSGQRIYS